MTNDIMKLEKIQARNYETVSSHSFISEEETLYDTVKDTRESKWLRLWEAFKKVVHFKISTSSVYY